MTVLSVSHAIPTLQGADLQDHVTAAGGPRRVLAAFCLQDVLFLSKINPDCFRHQRDDGLVTMKVPNIMIQGIDGSWVGVDGASVGFPTGAEKTREKLAGLGIPDDVVGRIGDHRFSDVDLAAPAAGVHTNDHPRVELHMPCPVGHFYVAPVFSPFFPEASWERHSRIKPLIYRGVWDTNSEGEPIPPYGPLLLRRWMELLDDPAAPEWMSGPRRARLYFTQEAARADGFTSQALPASSLVRDSGRVATVVIEQGRLQLWLDPVMSQDPTTYLTPELRYVLDTAGMRTADLVAHDQQPHPLRWLRHRLTPSTGYLEITDRSMHRVPDNAAR